MATKPLREKMPQVTAFLDDLRDAFGVDLVNEQIRRGMRGESTFYASEAGVELGTADTRSCFSVSRDALGNTTYRQVP